MVPHLIIDSKSPARLAAHQLSSADKGVDKSISPFGASMDKFPRPASTSATSSASDSCHAVISLRRFNPRLASARLKIFSGEICSPPYQYVEYPSTCQLSTTSARIECHPVPGRD